MAVNPATPSVDPAAGPTSGGRMASDDVDTAASWAQVPLVTEQPKTELPAAGPEPSAAAWTTTPATSQPTVVPAGTVRARTWPTSPRFREKAPTATTASDGRGSGRGTSRSSMSSGASGVAT